MRKQFIVFLVRLLCNMLGIWIAVRLFGDGHLYRGSLDFSTLFVAALIFSIVNAVIRPFVVILALPAILLTLGLFTIIVNGLMVWIAVGLTPGLEMTFWHAVLTGLVLSLVNYIVNGLVAESIEGNDYERK